MGTTPRKAMRDVQVNAPRVSRIPALFFIIPDRVPRPSPHVLSSGAQAFVTPRTARPDFVQPPRMGISVSHSRIDSCVINTIMNTGTLLQAVGIP